LREQRRGKRKKIKNYSNYRLLWILKYKYVLNHLSTHISTDIQCSFQSNPASELLGHRTWNVRGYENRYVDSGKSFRVSTTAALVRTREDEKQASQFDRRRNAITSNVGASQSNSFRARTFTVRKIEENNYDYLDIPRRGAAGYISRTGR